MDRVVKAGFLFAIPTRQVQNASGEWFSPTYRVNKVTGTGTVYYGVAGEGRSPWKISVTRFLDDIERGYAIPTD